MEDFFFSFRCVLCLYIQFNWERKFSFVLFVVSIPLILAVSKRGPCSRSSPFPPVACGRNVPYCAIVAGSLCRGNVVILAGVSFVLEYPVEWEIQFNVNYLQIVHSAGA